MIPTFTTTPRPTITPHLIARQLHIAMGMVDASGDEALDACGEATKAAYRAALSCLAGDRADALYELTIDHRITWDVAVAAVSRETAHDRAPATIPAGTKSDPRVTRKPTHGPDHADPDEDFLLFIDGKRIGGTYRCTYNPTDPNQPGPSWASWGCAGWSPGHATREEAEQAQADAYAGTPGLCPECDGEHPMVHTASGYTVCPACRHVMDLRGRAVRATTH